MIELTDEMVRAYSEATGINWAHLHINHRVGLAAVLAIVAREYDVLPKFRPHAHAFVRGDDPSFGSAFGGGCVAEVNGMVCGWPEQTHRQGSS